MVSLSIWNSNVVQKSCTIHALIHADDTIIISTNREMFIKKWEAAVQFFNDSKLNLNIGKSGYLIMSVLNDAPDAPTRLRAYAPYAPDAPKFP